MDYFEDDIFQFSDKDEDNPASTSECNPIEEHLVKQLHGIQNRIDKTKNEIEEIEQTVKDVSNALLLKAVIGPNANLDSNSELYTIEGEPVLKRKCVDNKRSDFLLLKDQWQYVLTDKWVIGVVLQNASLQPLHELSFYAFTNGANEIHGISTFWEQIDGFWKRINAIRPKRDNIMATLVIDPLHFDGISTIEIFGTIGYENLDMELQVVIPVVSFTPGDILRRTYELNYSGDTRSLAFLALRSTFVETVVDIPTKFESKKVGYLLQELNAQKIMENVYGIENNDSFVYVMIEILSVTKIRISAKTTSHLKLILRILQDEASIPITRNEDENSVEAAKALIEELETYLSHSDVARIHRARIKTDLLIP